MEPTTVRRAALAGLLAETDGPTSDDSGYHGRSGFLTEV